MHLAEQPQPRDRAPARGLRELLNARQHRHRPGGRSVTILRVRRSVAVALFALAIVLAVRPDAAGGPSAPLLVAARDLAAGSTLRASDVHVVRAPASFVPVGALRAPSAAVGGVLAGAARAGEPLTDARLVGRSHGAGSGAPGSAAVPIRLSDPDVADLLHPGAKVDVVTVDESAQGRRLLASAVTVLTVTAPREDRSLGQRQGRIVLISAPAEIATRIAAVSLNQPVTVTLR